MRREYLVCYDDHNKTEWLTKDQFIGLLGQATIDWVSSAYGRLTATDILVYQAILKLSEPETGKKASNKAVAEFLGEPRSQVAKSRRAIGKVMKLSPGW